MLCNCDSFQTWSDDGWKCAECGATGSSPFLAYDDQYEWVQGFPVKAGGYKPDCHCGANTVLGVYNEHHADYCPLFKNPK